MMFMVFTVNTLFMMIVKIVRLRPYEVSVSTALMINQMLMIVAIVWVVDVLALDNNQNEPVLSVLLRMINTIILNFSVGVGDAEDDCEYSWT